MSAAQKKGSGASRRGSGGILSDHRKPDESTERRAEAGEGASGRLSGWVLVQSPEAGAGLAHAAAVRRESRRLRLDGGGSRPRPLPSPVSPALQPAKAPVMLWDESSLPNSPGSVLSNMTVKVRVSDGRGLPGQQRVASGFGSRNLGQFVIPFCCASSSFTGPERRPRLPPQLVPTAEQSAGQGALPAARRLPRAHLGV